MPDTTTARLKAQGYRAGFVGIKKGTGEVAYWLLDNESRAKDESIELYPAWVPKTAEVA